jgi:hypothetical protein
MFASISLDANLPEKLKSLDFDNGAVALETLSRVGCRERISTGHPLTGGSSKASGHVYHNLPINNITITTTSTTPRIPLGP